MVAVWCSREALRLDLSPQRAFFDHASNLGPAYFGPLYADHGGLVIAGGPRPASAVPVMPVLATAVLSAALMPLWPYTRQDGITIAALIATTVQLVSPWNEAAALYTRYVRAMEKQRRKGQIA